MAPDPGTSLCVPCRQANASKPPYCSEKDATRCETDYHCADGFYCNVTGQCTSCPTIGCKACFDSETRECSECLPGYWDASQAAIVHTPADAGQQSDASEKAPAECKPCSDPNCLACTVSLGAACERCADGYFLERTTKRCREVGGCHCWRLCVSEDACQQHGSDVLEMPVLAVACTAPSGKLGASLCLIMCSQCAEPDGALYETCAPAPAAASAPGPASAAA